MAFDPRPDILGLFTDSKVSGTGKYKTEYIEIHIRERNWKLDRTYKNSSKGVISLDPPTMVKPDEKSIGPNGFTINQEVIIPCNLFIPLSEALNYQVDTFINDIVHSFEGTIFDNQLTTISNGVVDFQGCFPVPSKSGKNIRRLIYLRARKYETYGS